MKPRRHDVFWRGLDRMKGEVLLHVGTSKVYGSVWEVAGEVWGQAGTRPAVRFPSREVAKREVEFQVVR